MPFYMCYNDGTSRHRNTEEGLKLQAEGYDVLLQYFDKTDEN
jgi:hypothetical protein